MPTLFCFWYGGDKLWKLEARHEILSVSIL